MAMTSPAAARRWGCARLAAARPARTVPLAARCLSSSTINPESTAALSEHWKKTMDFHLAVDFDTTHGGYYQQINREGEVLDQVNRNLNNTTRGVYTYALAACGALPSPPHRARTATTS